ncbi:MAG: BatD family protein [Verrucomicrobiales bacterium]|nr:BatD family protein [Verrucomicrobiales bacterium]
MTRLLYIFLLSLFSIQGHGQDKTYKFSANLANPRIEVGDFGALELKAIGGEPGDPPRSIEVPGLSITYTGSQFHQDHEVIQGRVTTTLTYTYYYTIQGTRVGDYTIPGVEVPIRGESVKSNPVKVSIVKPAVQKVTPTGTRFATLAVPEGNLYVNQIFPVDATVYVKGRNSINTVSGASLKQEGLVIKRFDRVNLGAEELSGTVYSTAKLPTSLFALKEGDHRIGPATFNVKIYENTRFFAKIETRVVHSDSLRINVLPLPKGAPYGFSGGVGAFEMDLKATPVNLKVGDPIALEFTIIGDGNFQTLGAPFIKEYDPKVWKVYEPKKNLQVRTDKGEWINPSGDVFAERALFSQVLIPLQEVDKIPEFELNFFDPKVGQYIRRTTLATPITVSPDSGGMSTIPEVPVRATGGDFVSSPVLIPEVRFPDILHIRKDQPGWKPYSASSSPGFLLRFTNGLLGLAFVAFLGLGVFRKMKSKRVALRTKETAVTFRQAQSQVRPGMEREDFFHAALEAFSLWEIENPDSPAEIRSMVSGFKDQCETALYSDKHVEGGIIKTAEAAEILKVLRKLPSS